MLNRLFSALRGEDAAVVESPLSPLLEDVARPIPGANPCGEDVSYDPDFLRLKEEIDKLNAVDTHVDQEKAAELARQLKGNGARSTSATESSVEPSAARQASTMDADFVISTARTILSEKSKDLRVVSYLALGLARRDAIAGVAEAVGAYALLVESYWDGLYPPLKRMTGRKNAVEVGARWLIDALDGTPPTLADKESLENARSAIASLTAAFGARELPDLVLQLGVLDAKLVEVLARVPAADSRVPERPESDVTTRPEVDPVTNGVSHSTQGGPVVPQSATQAADMILRAAAWMRQADPRKAGSYRLARALRWDALTVPPPNEQRKTALEAPPAARRDYLLGLHKRGEWAELLREAESSFTQPPFHFWLDLQRLTVAALEGLGAEYAPVREAVVRELQLLVGRLMGLPTLLFADGRTRFADAATVSWLDQVVKPTGASTATPAATAPGRPTGGLAGRFAEPRKRFNEGDLAGALALLQRGASDDTSQHDRFLRRLYSATLCLEAGQVWVARALLEELEEEIEAHRLDQWDPALAFDVWTRLSRCYAAQARSARGGAAQEIGREMHRVFARMCRVDTTRALAAAQEAGFATS